MKIAVPDLVSNSYFPAIAAVELGLFAAEGLDLELELIFPVDKAYRALRDGAVAFVGGSAHSVPAAFRDWEGSKLLAALAQGMYWFLVMRSDIAGPRGDLSVVKGRRIGAAPMVDLGIRRILVDSNIDVDADRVEIMPVPGSTARGVSFGVNAAKALEEGLIDGFWANGMGAEVAVRRGVGKVVLDARRGDGPEAAFHYTMPALVTTSAVFEKNRPAAEAAVRAIVRTQRTLKENVGLATSVGKALFPAWEAELIADVVARDLPYYDPAISQQTYEAIARFAHEMGLSSRSAAYAEIVPAELEVLRKA
jgi:ABC-type nitrate/sulfonate/bicarbonate transport system substrate-binding protein